MLALAIFLIASLVFFSFLALSTIIGDIKDQRKKSQG